MQDEKFAILENGELKFVDVLTWGMWFETSDNRRVAKDTIQGVEISTVFLGLNHGFGGNPLWFETMVFGGEYDQFQRRYATLKEAKEGHRIIVAMVQESF
jgi:FKBP-type peptidyl-prolyl cis-trans isomerase 2